MSLSPAPGIVVPVPALTIGPYTATVVPVGASTLSPIVEYVVSILAVIEPAGIPTAETFGAASIARAINPVGIPTVEALGTPVLPPVLLVSGIASAEAFGNDADVHITGFTALSILGAEAFGVPAFTYSVSPDVGALNADDFNVVPVPVRNALEPGVVSLISPCVRGFEMDPETGLARGFEV